MVLREVNELGALVHTCLRDGLASRRVRLIVGLVVVLFCTAAQARQDDPKLNDLFRRLKDTQNPQQATLIESEIWKIWMSAERKDVDSLMQDGMSAISERSLSFALQAFDRVTKMDPEFAEGFNKRATVRYLRREFSASLEDIERTLSLEPRHFGALSGRGMIQVELGNHQAALEAYEEVLALYPQSPGTKQQTDGLRRYLGEKPI